MKTLTTLTAITTLLSINVIAQTGPEYLTITVQSNSTHEIQLPVSMTMEFSDYGDNTYDNYDTSSFVHVIGSSNDTFPTTYLPIAPFTVSSDGVNIDKFDSRPVFSSPSVFDFGFISNGSDSFTITASSFIDQTTANTSSNEKINYVYLEDLSTGLFYQILDNTATLAIPVGFYSVNYLVTNYQLHIIPKPYITTTPVTCFGSLDGTLSIHNPYCTNWNYNVYDNNGLIRTATVFNPDTALIGFMSDFYTIKVYMNGLLADSEKVFVDGPVEIIPSFIPDNYSVLTNDAVLFMNTSTGANTYSWTFGDAGTDNVTNPTHSYLVAGNYPVTLTAINANGCNASFTDTIHVADPMVQNGPHATRNNTSSNDPTARIANSLDVNVISGSEKITVNQKGEGQEILVQIMNLNGQLISSTSTSNQAITFDFLQAGIYLVSVTSANGEIHSEKVVVNN